MKRAEERKANFFDPEEITLDLTFKKAQSSLSPKIKNSPSPYCIEKLTV